MSKNVVIIGQSGAGKSSLINMICSGANALTSNDTIGCTRVEKKYPCDLGGRKSCQVHDTIGLEEGRWGFLPDKEAQKKLKTYLKNPKEPCHLLVYCMPGSRGLKKSHARNFKKFKSVVGDRVPVVVVVTNLEDIGDPLDSWWSENLEMLTKLGIPGTTEHACITALPKVHLRSDQAYLYNKSCENVKALIKSNLWPTTGR
ncbi:hypothetical protein BDR06DRAFT_962394 [Suillus hirtellus]|nr:hypothetical protein BDR06DRAFT_962394 [Suillus hirtellus]